VSAAAARLQRKIDLLEPAYGTPGRMLLEHPRPGEIFPRYHAAASYMALMMVPLMEAALDQSRALAAKDPVAAGLVGYLEHHIPEEMHGEQPGGELLEDLAVLGVDTDELRSGSLPPKVAALIGTLAFRIRFAHPVSVLGYLWPERCPPDAETVEELIERTGLPRGGFRQLLEHAEVDRRHGPELLAVLDALPLEPWHEQLVALSALETMAFLAETWLEIVANGRPAPVA
jgi:hypothetical protein